MSLQKFRFYFAVTIGGYLVVCNLAYLFSYSQNRWYEYSIQMDHPSVKFLSLLILVGIIGLSIPKDKETDEEQC